MCMYTNLYMYCLYMYTILEEARVGEKERVTKRGGGGDEGMIRGQESTIVHVHCTSIVLRFSNTFSLARFVACQQQVVLCT